MKEVVTYSAEIQGLHNTYFFLVEVIFRQFFKTTAAALTCAAHAAVNSFVLVECRNGWVLWVAGFRQPKASPPWNVGIFFVIFQ